MPRRLVPSHGSLSAGRRLHSTTLKGFLAPRRAACSLLSVSARRDFEAQFPFFRSRSPPCHPNTGGTPPFTHKGSQLRTVTVQSKPMWSFIFSVPVNGIPGTIQNPFVPFFLSHSFLHHQLNGSGDQFDCERFKRNQERSQMSNDYLCSGSKVP